MANELNVDADGLRAAAASSDVVAAGLTGAEFGGVPVSRTCGVGIAAVNAALISVQRRQSQRMTGQADDLTVGGNRYDTTDSGGADSIATVSV